MKIQHPLSSTLLTLALLSSSLTWLLADHHGDKKKSLDLAGAWKVEADTDNGTNHYTFTFEEKEGKWSGKSEDDRGRERAMSKVTVDGNKVLMETEIEAAGEKGVIRVTAEGGEEGETLKGKWAVIDSSDTERMSGELTASKIYVLDLAGEWDSVATVEGEERPSVTTFKKEGEEWKGGFKSDEHDATFNKITTEGKKLTCEFVLPIDGQDLDFRVSAEAKNDDLLEGKWVVFDDSGQEGYSGKWIAKRKKAFDLAGSWSATAEINGETYPSTYTIEKKDEALGGKITSDAGSIDLTSAKVDGDNVTIVFPFGEAEVTVKAAVKDDKLAGKWSATGPDGSEYSGDWSAERKKDS